ncbi:MAG: CapA family protein [Gammaproteobacteria bacterium]|nr:CapA family protein [Gammaproteobacteria bacterium]
MQLFRALAACAFFFIHACSVTPSVSQAPPEETSSSDSTTPEPPRGDISVVAVGDIMLGTDFPDNRLPPDDGYELLAHAAPLLKNADITFGNLEGVLLDGGEPFKRCENPSLCFLFRTPSRFVASLQQAGFDVLSLANNHARDFGEDGRTATMSALDSAGLAHSGRIGDIASLKVNNNRVALIAFSTGPESYSLLDLDAARQQIELLDRDHDIIIVSFHGGAEGENALHVQPGMEQYFGEDRGDLIAFSRAVIDAGADLVLGHGPHVPRALDVYRGRLIAYSLGNFATYYGISVSGKKGIAPVLHVELSPEGVLKQGRIYSMRQQRPSGPKPDPERAAFLLMRELSIADFGDRHLTFFDDGRFVPALPLEHHSPTQP